MDDLTDLIAAALGEKIMHTNGSGDRNRAYAAHVALVVEQHTNWRITELEAMIARVRALTLLNGRPRFGAIPVIDLCTALEGAS